MLSEHSFKRICYAAVILLTLIAVLAGASIFRGGFQVDTNLKSLSPSLSQDAVVNRAVDAMSTQASQKFMLVIANSDANKVEQASEALREQIETQQLSIKYVDQSAAMQSYLALLIKNRFQILSADTQELLLKKTDEDILNAAHANLYGSDGALRLVAFTDDPLGFVNQYALGVLNQFNVDGAEQLHEATLNGEKVFMSVHLLQLSSDALKMDTQEQGLTEINALKKSLLSDEPSLQFLQSGILFFAADSAQAAKKDINLISMGSTIGVILLFLCVFRSVKSLIIPVVSMVLGSLFAIAICHLLFGSIHILTIVFGASLIGVVGDYALHFYYFYHKKSSSENIMQLYRALLLSLMTSFIGYGALALSGLDALKQVAVFAGVGLVYAWLIVITLGSNLVQDNKLRVHDKYLQNIVAYVLTRLATLGYSAYIALALVLLLALLSMNRFNFPANDSPKAFFTLNPQLVQQEKMISGLVATHEPASFIVVDAESPSQVYERIDNIKKALGNDSVNLFGVHQLFPSPEQQKINYQLNQRLYSSPGLAEIFLEQNEIHSVNAKNLSDAYEQQAAKTFSPQEFFSQENISLPPFWLESGSHIYSFILIPKTLDASAVAARLANLDGVKFVSAIADVETSLKNLRFSALRLLFVALALICVLLLFQYKWLLTFKIMLVPTLSIVLSLTGLAALGIPLTLFHIMALFLVLGLSMDYVIFAAEMTKNSVETLTAIVLAAVTSLLSFGLLVFSSLPAVSAFGITVIIGSALNLFGAMALASQTVRKQDSANC